MFEQRLKNVRQKLIKEKLDGVLVASVSNISYLTGYANFSQEEREAYLLITKNEQFIITDGRYKGAVTAQIPYFKLLERSHGNSLKNIFAKIGQKTKSLGFEEDNLTVSEHKILIKHFENLKHFSLSRSIKEKEEIEKIEKACKVGDLAFDYILKRIKVGVTEKEITLELENFIKKRGAQFSFPAIIAFGKNSSVPHHQTGQTKLRKNQFVLMDFGINYQNYCSDMTRTVFFGKPSEKQKDIYQTVLKAQQQAVKFFNSVIKLNKKVKASEVDKVARSFILSKGYPTIPYSLGHGIGLEVHEHPSLSPKSKDILKKGMVFSIEPGIYIPNFGGVRIEDLYVYENGALKQITISPKNLIEV